MKVWMKISLSILCTITIAFVGFITLLFASLIGMEMFYQILFPVGIGTILLLILSQIWGWFENKWRLRVLGIVFGIIIVCVSIFEIKKSYENSIDTINEQGVNLEQYEPFRKNTKAVILNEESNLKLEGNLPKLDGATALYPLYSAFTKAVYPEDDYRVNIQKENDYVICTNTVGAYQRLIMGNADIIFVAGPSKEQLEDAKNSGVELEFTPIGKEAFVFFVNSKNSIDNLSVEDIQNIYSGNTTNWIEFGGKNVEIRAFQRPDNSGSQTMLNKIMGNIKIMTPPQEDVATGMGGIIKNVSSYKNYDNSIGYSFLFFASEMVNDNKIKLLSINDIYPNKENVQNKTYPYSAEFYAVTLKGNDDENVKKLIDWILSEQGQYLVEKTGYTRLELV